MPLLPLAAARSPHHPRAVERLAPTLLATLLLACGDPGGPEEPPVDEMAPPSGQIAFVAGTPGTTPSTADLYLVNTDGTRLTRLTNTPGTDETGPRWSNDGRRLSYAVAGGSRYEMNADGTDVRALPPAPRGVLSPDGQRIAYPVNGLDESMRRVATLFVANADSSEAVAVASSVPSVCAGACPFMDEIEWSPDGRRLVCRQWVSGTGGLRHGDLWVANADGTSGAVPLTSGPGFESNPRWSPDGQRIAFTTWCGCMISGLGTELHVINADGTGSTQLTARAESGVLTHAGPSWSPDGRWLAVARGGPNTGDQKALYAMPAEPSGAAPRRVAALPAGVLETAWRLAVTAP